MWPKRSTFRATSFLALAVCTTLSTAKPLLRDDSSTSEPINATLVIRCDNPCGWAGQLCCNAAQQCYTDSNNLAQCGGPTTTPPQGSGGGYWQYYTSTWVETNLITKTSVYSSYITAPPSVPASATWTPPAQATETGSAAQCDWDKGESSCGNICCSSVQYCLVAGQCANAGEGSVSGGPSAPLRVTSSSLYVVTNTIQPTTTVGFQSAVGTGTGIPVTSSSSSSGLSGGAIAGIVIGVLLGLFILFLVCLCLCFRAAWDGLLAIFGFGKKRKRTETVEYEHYSRHGDSRRWYGDRPGRPDRPPPKKSNGIGWTGIAAGLGGLAVLLGLKRRHDRRQEKREKVENDYSNSSFYSEDYTISDDRTASSDRRTRDTRRSRSRRG